MSTPRRIFGKNGPGLADKNLGKWHKEKGKTYPAAGRREAARTARRLARKQQNAEQAPV